jgi:hypothetical protein
MSRLAWGLTGGAICGLLLCACNRGIPVTGPVPGLTLPLGAYKAPLSAGALELYGEQKQAAASARSSARTVMTGFSCNGTFDAVVQHIEGCLRPLGYRRLKPLYIPREILSVQRKVYFSPDDYVQVQLSDWTAQNLQANDYQGKARFLLLVIRAVPTDVWGRPVELEGGEQMLEDF